MKKFLFTILTFILCFSLFACKKDKNDVTKKEEVQFSELKFDSVEQYLPKDNVKKEEACDYTATIKLSLNAGSQEIEGEATIDFKANTLKVEKLSDLEAYLKVNVDLDADLDKDILSIVEHPYEIYLKESVLYAVLPGAILDQDGSITLSANLDQIFAGVEEFLDNAMQSVPAGLDGVIGDLVPEVDLEKLDEIELPSIDLKDILNWNITNVLELAKELVPELYGELEKAGLTQEFIEKINNFIYSLIPSLKKEDGKFVLVISDTVFQDDINKIVTFLSENKETIVSICKAAAKYFGADEETLSEIVIEDEDLEDLREELKDALEYFNVKDFAFKFDVDKKGIINGINGKANVVLTEEEYDWMEDEDYLEFRDITVEIDYKKSSSDFSVKADINIKDYDDRTGIEDAREEITSIELKVAKIENGAKLEASLSDKYAGEREATTASLNASWTQTDTLSTAKLEVETKSFTGSLEFSCKKNGNTATFDFDTTTALDMTGTILSLIASK